MPGSIAHQASQRLCRFPLGALLVATLLCLACQDQEATPEQSNFFASYDGGHVSVSELEAQFLLRRQNTTGTPPTLQEAKSIARKIVWSKVFLQRIGSTEELEFEARSQLASLHRDLLVAAKFQASPESQAPIAEQEIEDFWKENQHLFEVQDRRMVHYIYISRKPGMEPEALLEQLEKVRTRWKQGENFERLARRFSESETRELGGRLGWIQRGRFPQDLEEIIFSLPLQTLSEPIVTAEGGFLFLVSQKSNQAEFSFSDVRHLILPEIRLRHRREWLRQQVADDELPEGSKSIPVDQLEELLQQPGLAEEILIQIEDDVLTRGQLSELLEERNQELLAWPNYQPDLKVIYLQCLHARLLGYKLRQENFPENLQARRELQKTLERTKIGLLADRGVKKELLQRLKGQEPLLRQFYQDNQFLYQSPLRFQLRQLSVPVSNETEGNLNQLIAMRKALVEKTVGFEEVAQKLDTTVNDLGWVPVSLLDDFEPKVREYILQTPAGGFSVPFHHDGQLHLIWVQARENPESLPYEEVQGKLIQDYYERHQQRLYQDLVQETLDSVHFKIHPESLKRLNTTREALP